MFVRFPGLIHFIKKDDKVQSYAFCLWTQKRADGGIHYMHLLLVGHEIPRVGAVLCI